MALTFHGRWDNLKFTKDGDEIIEALQSKIKKLKAMTATRSERINTICKDKNISAAEVFEHMEDIASNMYSNAVITAGEKAQLQKEATTLNDEKRTLKLLTLFAAHLPEDKSFDLTPDQLEYLFPFPTA